MIRSIFSSSFNPDEDKNDDQANSSTTLSFSKGKSKKEDVIILSNEDPNKKRLDELLGGFNTVAAFPGAKGKSPAGSDVDFAIDDIKVEVTLRTQLGQAPVIMLLFALGNSDGSSQPVNLEAALSKVSISLEVGLNGRVAVVDMTGLLDDDGTTANSMHEQVQSETLELQAKIAKVLEMSQDIGILVEWMLRWARQRKGR